MSNDALKNSSRTNNESSLGEIGNIINWKEKFNNLNSQYKTLLEENERLKRELDESKNGNSKKSLPTKDEMESISSMLDIINKLDDRTIDKIERLGKK